jgi:poly-gamma-glutamate synthesis protein (capsule biosynthesis protein)
MRHSIHRFSDRSGYPLQWQTMKLCVLALLFVAHTSCQANGKRTQQEPADSTLNAQHSSLNSQPSTLNLIIAGDLMQHGPQIKAAFERGQNQARLNTTDYKTGNGTYNYDECFASVKDEIERADVAIANFEVTLGGKPYTGYPQFRAPDEYLQACIDAGFDILLTANNHCVDSRRKGLERTIAMMDSLGVPHLGTYINSNVREDTYPFLLEKNGIRVVLLNFTYGTNGLPVEEPNVVNLIDTVQIRADLEKAKAMQPDVIIALPHWGIEYQQLPSPQQRELAHWLISNGVDHVIGGHPHVAQPLELSPDSLHLVAWSMGNVISNQSKPNTYGGYMVKMELTKKQSAQQGGHADTKLTDCSYMLYWVSRPSDSNNRHNYRILPIDVPDSVLTGMEQKNRHAIRASMRRLMERHGQGVKEYLW